MLIKSVIFLIILAFTLTVGQSEGDSCTAERTNSAGKCTMLSDCPSVIVDLRNGRSHTRCGFQGKNEIVCCPDENTSPTPRISGTGRLHEKKCKEYQSAVYEYVTSGSLLIGAERIRIPISKCGHTQVPLIVGGEVAGLKEFPHMALVGFTSGPNQIHWGCGGTLISDRYVLTAAHCLYSRDLSEPQFVRLGAFIINSDKDDPEAEDFKIEQIIPHPDWRSSSNYNDIGLIKLNRNVNLNPFKRPACLPVQFDGPEKRNIATGWGDTQYAGSGSQQLRKVTLEKFSHSECNDIYSVLKKSRKLRDGIRNDTQLCAGSKDEKKDTCQADSGGPLQVYHHSEFCMYTIIGITSFGVACGTIGVPGIYTRVFPYVDWIENTVWKS